MTNFKRLDEINPVKDAKRFFYEKKQEGKLRDKRKRYWRHEIKALYCDHCGETVYFDDGGTRWSGEYKPYVDFTELPWDIDTANKGESGTVCLTCKGKLEDKAKEEQHA